MDNTAIARVLREIADLLEIKDDNPFKIRAYRNGADIVSNHPHELATLDVTGLREIPGIGKDLAARIREIAETGDAEFHRELIAEFPPTILDLLQSAGRRSEDRGDALSRARHPNARRPREGGRRRTDPLAARHGREEGGAHPQGARRAQAARRPASPARCARHRLGARRLPPRARAGRARSKPVGSLRRGCETCGDIDILGVRRAALADGRVRRATASSSACSPTATPSRASSLQGGFQADLRLVAADSRGAALQYFTGSKAHNIALRDRAIGLGFKLNEYGLFRVEGDEKVAGETEEGVYEALGLAVGPAGASRGSRRDRARRGRGSCPVWSIAPICAATCTCTRPRPTARTTSRRWPRRRATAASSTSPSPITASRWRWPTAWTSGGRSRTPPASAPLDGRDGVRLLAGIECDIRPDGSLDLDDDCLAALDLVVASVHSAFNQDRQQMTDRILRAIENPYVDILGHPTGRLILRREPYPVDIDAVLDAAARHGVALEINCQLDRLDLNDVHARLARERGVPIVISSDAHSTRGAWLDCGGASSSRGAPGSSRSTCSTHARSRSSRLCCGGTAADPERVGLQPR